MRLLLAICLGKFISKITRSLNIGGGSAAPGLYALKVDPNLVLKLIQQIPHNIVISGTNGKTTTARMLAHTAKDQNKKILRNTTGSNLERGIASALIMHSNFFCRIKNVDLGIWELDEAAFNLVTPKIKPETIVFLNAFRDQLDRYGEVDTVVKKWQQTIGKLSKNTRIFINGDDSNLLKLKDAFSGTIQSFGIIGEKIIGEKNTGTKSVSKLDYEAKNIESFSLDQTTFAITDGQKLLQVTLPLPGIYNIYNFLAAFIAGRAIGLNTKQATNSLANFSSAFGRVEKIKLGDKIAYIFLIKNPIGATQVFKTIKNNFKVGDTLLIALNDNLADGTDVSWIWDANFELIQNSSRAKARDYRIICSGTRAYDLSLRLKYAGAPSTTLQIQTDLKLALEDAQRGLKGRLFILPTYTALLSLQKILASKGIKKQYWREV